MFRVLTASVRRRPARRLRRRPGGRQGRGKEETLKGTITCGKCDLKLADKCATVIKVGEKVYWFDEATSKKYHKEVCTEAKEGTVTGTVKKDGDKMIVTATKVEFKK